MTPVSSTVALLAGQRWKWDNRTIVEIIENTTIKVGETNSIKCKVVHTSSGSARRLGSIDYWTFGDCLGLWEYLEGQDKPQ